MREVLVGFIVFLGSVMSYGTAQGCSAEAAQQFDFWLGEWELTWPAEQSGGAVGQTAKGTNRIEKILNGCVVQENFAFANGGYRGQSVSVYNPQLGEWRQTWVDTGGGYLLFTGGFEEGRMELRTEAREREGKTLLNRMVFRDISEEALNWDWQRSEDGGETWIDVWNIAYQRVD